MSKENYELYAEDKECTTDIKMSFMEWVKAHKKKLIIAGISITTVLGIVLGFKNKHALEKLWSSLETKAKNIPITEVEDNSMLHTTDAALTSLRQTRNYTSPTEIFDVRGHIRTMPITMHHSPEKAAEATTLGIELLPNQTLVRPYTKNAA